MDVLTVVLFFIGLVLLIGGAELLVRGASELAEAVGISPLVVGLTVVAFGTGSPELAVSIQSTFAGQADLTLGNVIGSNIANVLLILGISSLVTPLIVAPQLLRRDVPIMIGVSVLMMVLSINGSLGRFSGVLMLVLLAAYLTFSIRQAHKEDEATHSKQDIENRKQEPRKTLFNVGKLVIGLGMLILGSQWLVNGAVEFAQLFGVSELIIGLTVVAVGTSLPEIATSVIAGLRGEREIAVGNAVGSNIFNILAVLGITALVAPEPIKVPASAFSFDIPIMIAAAVACLPIFFTGKLVARWEGVLFLAYYAAYTAYLVLAASNHDALSTFSMIMALFVVPLTVITLIVTSVQSFRHERGNATS